MNLLKQEAAHITATGRGLTFKQSSEAVVVTLLNGHTHLPGVPVTYIHY